MDESHFVYKITSAKGFGIILRARKLFTRNRDKMRSAFGKREFMHSNFCFVGIHIWNYILHHLDVNVTIPKLKKTIQNTYFGR